MKTKKGKNFDEEYEKAFKLLCFWMKEPRNKGKKHTVTQLRQQMCGYLPDGVPDYDLTAFKDRLSRSFGGGIKFVGKNQATTQKNESIQQPMNKSKNQSRNQFVDQSVKQAGKSTEKMPETKEDSHRRKSMDESTRNVTPGSPRVLTSEIGLPNSERKAVDQLQMHNNFRINNLIFSSIKLVSDLDKLGIHSIFVASMETSVYTSASSIGHDFIKKHNLKESFKKFCVSSLQKETKHETKNETKAETKAEEPEVESTTDPVPKCDDDDSDDDLDVPVDNDDYDFELDIRKSVVEELVNSQRKKYGTRSRIKVGNSQFSEPEKKILILKTEESDQMESKAAIQGLVTGKPTEKSESNVEITSPDPGFIDVDAEIKTEALQMADPTSEKPVLKKKKYVKKAPGTFMTRKCSNCSKKMVDHFLINGVSVSEIPSDMYKCDECHRVYDTMRRFKGHHLKYHPEMELYTCCYQDCNKRFQYFENFKSHIKGHTRVFKFKCDQCDKAFTQARGLESHLATHIDPTRVNFQCDRCMKKFGSALKLERHRLDTNCESKFVCCECNQKFRKADLLKVHMVNHDMGLEKFMCNECDRLFSTWNTFYHHVMMTHEVWRTSYCTECKDKFATEAGLLRHRCRALNDQIEIEKIPSEKKPEKSATICEICGDMFVEKFLLKRHLETHLGSKDYHCHSCTRSYYSLESLKNHIKSIHEECLLKFPCEICGKEFSKQYKLSHHMKYHSDEKPYQCSICGVSYKEKGKLRKHFMNHTGEKPYPCAVCNRRFKDKPKLRQHMMTHTGERPYGCEMCGKRFPSRTSLQIHIMSKAHKGETPFTCDYCHRGFSRKPYMKLHMKRRNCVPNLDKNVHTNDFVAMFENEKNKCSIIGSGPMPVDLGAEEFVRSDPSLSFFDFKSFSK